MIEEKRSSPRIKASYQITFEYFLGGIKIGEGEAQTVDISEHGALITLPQPVDLNGSMILSVSAPFYTLVVRGNVVHSRRVADGSFRVGLKLTETIEGNWDHLMRNFRPPRSESDNAF